MPDNQEKDGVCISTNRKFPSTVATQFSDNAIRPFWSFKDSTSVVDDFFDCYVSFKELNCHEYLWDWKGRKVDELLVKKLVSSYEKFFRKNPIGKNCFITFRVGEDYCVEELGRLYMSVITTNDFAAEKGLDSPPLFEVVHSTTSSNALVKFANLYNECVGIATEKLNHDCGPKVLSVIPTHNFSGSNWYSNINSFMSKFQSSFRCRIEYVRPMISRATLANDRGFVGAVFATKRALSNYASFSQITGVESYPILDAGTLMFRGGMNPSDFRQFIETYPGTRTVSITPAFRYDHPLEEVKESVAALNRLLPKNGASVFTRDELVRMTAVENVFAKHFKAVVKKLNLDSFAEEMARVKRPVDSRIKFSFALYSLGVPPEFLGTGNAILECIKKGLIGDLEHFYPAIKTDLKIAGVLLNKENLRFLAKIGKGWKSVLEDVKLVEDYIDSSLGPDSARSFMHRNHASNVFHLWTTHQNFAKDLLAAARLRRCLG